MGRSTPLADACCLRVLLDPRAVDGRGVTLLVVSNRRSKLWRSDGEILGRDSDVALLRAVASGRVVRGSGGDMGIMSPHMLAGEPIRLQLRWLADQELVEMPISGPPALAPRGRRLLAITNGEIAMPRE